MQFYYIKVSGIPSGNKLIRYPHMWRCRWFHWHQDCLLNCTKFVGVSSKYLQVFLESLRQSSEIFVNLGKSSEIFGNFRTFSENFRERPSGLRDNFGKSSEIFEKSSKTPLSVCSYNKKEHYTLARRYKFYVRVARTLSHG